MKVNRKNPIHWLYLLLFWVSTVIALLIRPFVPKPKTLQVLLYGHKLNSNLLSLYLEIQSSNIQEIEVRFLTMDPAYYEELLHQGNKVVCGIYPSSILKLAKSSAIISDHGLHCLSLLIYFSNVKFFDVWHGIPFKGFDADDFKVQQQFTQTWVTSEFIKKLYVEKFGFNEEKVSVTGYGRTDLLLHPPRSPDDIKKTLNLPVDTRKIVLFAPTWQHSDSNRSNFPFGASEESFFAMVTEVCKNNNAIALFRSHLNSNTGLIVVNDPMYLAPHEFFPDTEAILTISNLLICDWSSIAFDFLVLDRPTLFLDVPHPFAKGLSLGPEYRFGKLVKSLEQLEIDIGIYLKTPALYHADFKENADVIKSKLYDQNLDGEVASRYLELLVANH